MGVEGGQMLSHYRLVEKIGEGGMGVVWKANDTILDRTVAIKVLRADLAPDEKRRVMFLDEARLAASVSHGNIAQVFELGREGDVDFIVMEYVEGQPLSQQLHGQPLPPDKVADWGWQVAQGLTRAHRKNLIHRDLKPKNILVTPDGELKIVDFGLAILFELGDTTVSFLASTLTETLNEETRTRIAGTLPYMSPEQVRGEKLDPRSDIFSFGTVLYEMTTGLRPFVGATPTEIAQKIQKSQPRPIHELVPSVPLKLGEIIEKAMARKPEERYQHMDDLAVDLQRLRKGLDSDSAPAYADLQPKGPDSGPSALSEDLDEDRRQWRRWLGAAVVVVALVAAWGGWNWWHHQPVLPPPERPTIAVRLFQNLSVDGPYANFADGLHEELLGHIARIEAVKVISTTKPVGELASELGAGGILEGSVQVDGDRLRVNARLIDVATGRMWAERYDRTLNDALAIQSELAQLMATGIRLVVSDLVSEGPAVPPTKSPEAYKHFLEGVSHEHQPGWPRQDLQIAQRLYEEALELDPNFVLAHVRLSKVHGIMFWYRYDPSAARAAHQREEAEAALRLAPDLPEAHFAIGLWHYWGRRDYKKALEEFSIALRGRPLNPEFTTFVGAVHRRLGNWENALTSFQAVRQFKEAGDTGVYLRRYSEAVQWYAQAPPELHEVALSKAWAYVRWQGQLDTLRVVLSRLPWDAALLSSVELRLWERDTSGLLKKLENVRAPVVDDQGVFRPCALYKAWAHQLRGDRVAARAAFGSALVFLDSVMTGLPDDYRVHAARGLALAGLGQREEALQEATWLQQSVIYREDAAQGPELAEERARILAQSGDADAALDEIEELLAKPSGVSVHTLRLDPRWDPIRKHQRFKTLLAKYVQS